MKKLSIIVPVYYNAESLPDLFAELCNIETILLKKNIQLELIFVDDGSGDDSFLELLQIKGKRPETKIVKLARNFGAVHASRTGLKYVTGDGFLTLAADLQDPPVLLVEMVERWVSGEKFVICVRQSREDPFMTKVFARIYYLILRNFAGVNYPRRGFDLALMDKVMLPYMQQSAKNINPNLFSYWLGFQPSVIYYKRCARHYGKSKWTFSKKLKFFLDSILGFSIVPIRMISTIGLIVSGISFCYGCIVVYNAMRGNVQVQGFATLVALLSFLLGLIIVMLGVIGEYIWRIFDEVNRQPEAVIEKELL
jgi:dolichol-phosphate mannosyltransferase